MKRLLLIGLFFIPFAYLQAARPTVSLSALPTTIIPGGSSTLTWTSTGATSASINNGIGSVPVNGSMTVAPTITTTYTITVRNSSGSRTASAKVTVTTPLPTVTFAANPTSILKGQSSTLSWTTTNATSASINQNIGTVALNGSRTVMPTATITYTITVKGGGGTVTATAKVTVTTAPPTVSFSAAPAIIEPGQSSMLTWSVQNATSVSIDNGIGTVSASGSRTVTPTASITYTLTANGTGGTTTRQATVTVALPPTVTFSAAPMSIKAGESATLTWTCENADTVVIDHGIGNVGLNGSLTVNPTQDTVYTMTASGTGIDTTAKAFVYINNGRNILAFIPNYLEQTLKIFDTADNSQIGVLDISLQTSDKVRCIAISPFGDRVYYGNKTSGGYWFEIDPGFYVNNRGSGYSGRINLRSYENRKKSGHRDGIDRRPDAAGATNSFIFDFGPAFIAISPDGRYLYACCGASPWGITDPNQDKTVVGVLDLHDMMVVRQVRVPRKTQTDFALSPDGATLYVVADNVLQAFDTEKLKVPQIFNPNDSFVDVSDELKWEIPQCPAMAVHPDGNRIFVAGNPIKVIDVATRTVIQTLDISGAVSKMFISPDGERLFVNQEDFIAAYNLSTWVKQGDDTYCGKDFSFGISPEGSQIFFVNDSCFGGTCKSFLHVVDAATMQTLKTIQLENGGAGTNGNFVGRIANTVSGQVTFNGNGFTGGGEVRLSGTDFNYSTFVQSDGSFCTAVRDGSYTVSLKGGPGYVFTPQQQEVYVAGNSVSDVNFEVSTLAPKIQAWANPDRIEIGQVATLFWESQNADNVEFEWPRLEQPSGNWNVSPSATTNYHFTAYGPGGSASTDVTVYVGSKLPTLIASVNPATIVSGQSSTITWTSTDATSASIDQGIGSVPVNGSLVVTPAATTTYTITVTGPGGTATASVTVTVGAQPTVAFTASPASIQAGQSSTLSWTSTNAASANIDNGIGSVPVNGSQAVTPTATTTYTITVTGPGGSTSASTAVTISEAPVTVTFGADPEFIPPGGSSTLVWTTKDATSVSINQGIGAVDLNGSLKVSPTSETTYTLTASGPGGSNTASVTVKMLDAHLRIIWNGMKEAMASGNIEQAASYFCEKTREEYKQIFTNLSAQLIQIAQEMGEIEPLLYNNNMAVSRIKRNDMINGEVHEISYRIYFIYQYEKWMIYKY